MTALFVDHLTVMDFSYIDADRGIVGESWIVDVVLHGELDEQGMVFDFGHAKKHLKQAIDEGYDHRLLVPQNLPEFEQQETLIRWKDHQGRDYYHQGPADAIVQLATDKITPETVAPLLSQDIARLLPSNVTRLELKLRPEQIQGAFYHYSHGLKKHLGNCQRIAHGHRSAIEIYCDQQRSPELEAQLATTWQDIYIGSRDDLSQDFEQQGTRYYVFAYQAQQGSFKLLLPAERCYLIDTDSTVELLATHLANKFKQDYPDQQITVKAFEGVWKGALASSN